MPDLNTLETMLTLIPAGVDLVAVCPGDQLIFACNTTNKFLKWIVTLSEAHSNGLLTQEEFVTRGSVSTFDITLNGTLFNITKTSNDSDELLKSTLTIMSASTNLDGTTINCTELGEDQNNTNSSVAVIEVITVNKGKYSFKILTLN